MGLSVVVPVGENDESWKELIQDLKALDSKDEVIFVSCTKEKVLESSRIGKQYQLKCHIRWLRAPKGRARQMNFGAKKAKNKILWFLHCDSRAKKSAIIHLKKQLQKEINQIYFFRLTFLKDGPRLMRINDFGVWIRSELMGLPFGDQGFCMHSDTFKHLGGFCETASYGEDHLLIWKAHQKQIRLSCIKVPLYTSSRRYKSNGWLNTTLKHIYLTYKQATPEFFKLIRSKVAS
jgi:rSAM/selenodomain-associated transferase 2